MMTTNIPFANRLSELALIDPSSLDFPQGAAERTTGMYIGIHEGEAETDEALLHPAERQNQGDFGCFLCEAGQREHKKGERRRQHSGKPKCEGYNSKINSNDICVGILLATYNGEKYLTAQLESLLSSSHTNWRLLIRDDGSSDATLRIIDHYCKQYPERIACINLYSDHYRSLSPNFPQQSLQSDLSQSNNLKFLHSSTSNLGATQSYFELLRYSSENVWWMPPVGVTNTVHYIMFCDQDDVWLPNKIAITLDKMLEMEAEYGSNMPLLVHTDLQVTDEYLKILAISYWKYRHLDPKKGIQLNRLLTQNVVTGCTMMINTALRNKFILNEHRFSEEYFRQVIMHDWWLALVAAVFGKIGYVDDAPIYYRQHLLNVTGAKKWDIKYILENIKNFMAIKKRIATTQQQAAAFLEMYQRDFMDQKFHQSCELLKVYAQLQNYPYLKRKYLFIKNKYFLSGLLRNIAMFFWC